MIEKFNKKISTISIIILFIVFSWIGYFDNYSEKYIDESVVQASIAYATARGINALVSTLQSSTLEVSLGVGGSIAIGEVLDPLNDLIERFSEIMTFALGSLIIQKIIIVITANNLLKILITIFGLSTIVVLRLNRVSFFPLFWRLFVALIFVRFSLSLVVSLNSVVDNTYLSQDIQKSSKNLNKFKQEITHIKDGEGVSNKKRTIVESKIISYKSEIRQLREKVKNGETELKIIDAKLKDTNTEFEKNVDLKCRLNPWCDDKKGIKLKKEIKTINSKKEIVESNIEKIKSQIGSIEEKITDQKDQLKEGGSWWSKYMRFDVLGNKLNPNNISKIISENVNSIVHLLMLFLLKSILIPLLFFYLLLGLFKYVWTSKELIG